MWIFREKKCARREIWFSWSVTPLVKVWRTLLHKQKSFPRNRVGSFNHSDVILLTLELKVFFYIQDEPLYQYNEKGKWQINKWSHRFFRKNVLNKNVSTVESIWARTHFVYRDFNKLLIPTFSSTKQFSLLKWRWILTSKCFLIHEQ